MERYLIPLAVAAGAILLLLAVAAFLIFLKIFYAARGKSKGAEEFPLPEGAVSASRKQLSTVFTCLPVIRTMRKHPRFSGVFLRGMGGGS